jgi:hypothetical protein
MRFVMEATSGETAWFVTNGERVVGPMPTADLVRSVAMGQIGESCQTWHEGLPGWRPLDSIREVRALIRARASRGDDWIPSETWKPGGGPEAAARRAALWMDDAADESEVVALALQAVVLETRAHVGLAHRPKRALGALETRAVFGSIGQELLGYEVPADDLAIRIARRGTAVLERGPAGVVPQSRALCVAGASAAGVALAPIYLGAKLVAVLEVAREDRAFRRGDRAWMRAVVRAAATRMAS